MLKRLIIALLLLAVYACSDPPLVVWEQHSLTESELDDCANEPCPDITINYTLAKGEGTVSESINTQIEARMMAVFTNAEDAPNSLEDAIQSFTKRYQELLTDFPESAGADNYEAQVEVTNHGQIGNIASLEHWAYLYEGGAHGWSGSDFLNFDLRTGTQLSMDDLFTDQKTLLDIAEKAFRDSRELPENGSLNEQGGFWFDEDRFRLPETVGIGIKGLLIIYNPYDIASYADGSIEFTIPLEQIEHLINPDLL